MTPLNHSDPSDHSDPNVNRITARSPAKLNLFLHITGKRPDGYHNLQTLFQIIDIADTLTFTPRTDHEIRLTHPLDGVPASENLIIKAATALQAHYTHQHGKAPTGINIQLDKVLPMGGGLGGGSSNAATTLSVLNRLWQLNLPAPTLTQIGRTLGADVPIFLLGRSAWAEGIGEVLIPVELPEYHYLVVTPPCHADTAQLFQHKALQRNHPKQPTPLTTEGTLTHTIDLDPLNITQTLGNSFEPVVRRLYPEIDTTLSWLEQFGPAQLTGTGSSCFVPFKAEAAAQQALEQSKTYFKSQEQARSDSSPGWQLFLTKGINPATT